MPDGEYKLGVNDVVVEDGDAKLKSDGDPGGEHAHDYPGLPEPAQVHRQDRGRDPSPAHGKPGCAHRSG